MTTPDPPFELLFAVRFPSPPPPPVLAVPLVEATPPPPEPPLPGPEAALRLPPPLPPVDVIEEKIERLQLVMAAVRAHLSTHSKPTLQLILVTQVGH